MGQPLVSVCIPAYNSAETIRETVASVLSQTYGNLELIIVDDQSKDTTWEVIKELADQDERIKIYLNQQNLGMAGNWNRCLELCSGEYIKLLCADDLIHETLIEREVALMEEYPQALLVQTDTRFIDINGKTTDSTGDTIRAGWWKESRPAVFPCLPEITWEHLWQI